MIDSFVFDYPFDYYIIPQIELKVKKKIARLNESGGVL